MVGGPDRRPKSTPPVYKLVQTKVYLVESIEFYANHVSKRKNTNDREILKWDPKKTAAIFLLETTLHITSAIAIMIAILINAPQFWLRVVLKKSSDHASSLDSLHSISLNFQKTFQ